MATLEELTGDGPGSLSRVLEFDHVVRIDAAGQVSDAPDGVWAPECYDPVIDSKSAGGGWDLITSGLTGQHGYRGPWLHDSEVIEGGVARHILAHAADNGGGLYVAVYATYPADVEGSPYGEETTIEGWAIAYRKEV